MLLRISVLLFVFCGFFSSNAQLNPYKYIVVPTHFEVFKKENQHQTSTLVKYYLTENGFPAIYDTQQPTELRIDPCQAAYVKLRDDSGMFMTRVVLQFVDCQGEVVFETMEGTSKEKNYVDAYKGAIAEAFQSIAGMGYSYSPVAENPDTASAAGNAGAPSAGQAAGQAAVQAAGQATGQAAGQVTREESARALEAARGAIPQRRESPPSSNMPTATRPNPEASGAAGTGTEPGASETTASDSRISAADSGELLYAQEIENGYQLVDSTPKIRMKLMKTSQADRYIVLVDGNTRGMLYQQGDSWIHEYYEEGNLRTERLRIKF